MSNNDDRLRGFENITALGLGNGKLGLAVAAPGDATTAMVVIDSNDYDSPQEFGMDVVLWCRKYGEQKAYTGQDRQLLETSAMAHAQELVA